MCSLECKTNLFLAVYAGDRSSHVGKTEMLKAFELACKWPPQKNKNTKKK